MNSGSKFEEKFLDFLEGKLSAPEKVEFEQALRNDSTLAESFRLYKLVTEAEKSISQQKFELRKSLRSDVMSQIKSQRESIIAKLMRLIVRGQLFDTLPRRVGGLATLAAAAIAVVILIDSTEHGTRDALQYRVRPSAPEVTIENLKLDDLSTRSEFAAAGGTVPTEEFKGEPEQSGRIVDSKKNAAAPPAPATRSLDLLRQKETTELPSTELKKEKFYAPKVTEQIGAEGEGAQNEHAGTRVDEQVLSDSVVIPKDAPGAQSAVPLRDYPVILSLLDRGIIVRPDMNQRLEFTRYLLGGTEQRKQTTRGIPESASTLGSGSKSSRVTDADQSDQDFERLIVTYLSILGEVSSESVSQLQTLLNTVDNNILMNQKAPDPNVLKFKEIIEKTRKVYAAALNK